MFQKHLFYLSQTYLRPWNKGRAVFLLGAMPGLFAAALQSLAFTYTMAGEGLWFATGFHVLRLALLGLLGFSVTYWILSRRFWRTELFLIQFLGLLFSLYDSGSAVANGLSFFLTAGPFWAVYNLGFSTSLTKEGHGHETALILFLQTISMTFGTFLSGVLLQTDLYRLGMLLVGGGFIFSTQLLARKRPKEPVAAQALRLVGWRKPLSRLTVLIAAHGSLSDFALPTWMRLVGLSPLSTGLHLALTPLLAMVFAPLAGFLLQKGGLHSGRLGGLALIFGWIALGFASNYSLFLLPALVVLKLGNSLISSLEVNRWFKHRSAPAVVAREYLLAAGRVSSSALFLPCVFLSTLALPIIGFAHGCLLFFGAKKKRG